MKKYLSLILVMALLSSRLCMGVSAARVGTDDPSSNTSVDVNIKMDDSGLQHKYCVEIEFQNMLFVYTLGNSTWDPEKYDYTEGTTEDRWVPETSATIKITNHSDLPIKYELSDVNTVSTYGNLSVNFSSESGNIGGCTPGMNPGDMFATSDVSLSGVPNDNLTSNEVKLANIKLVISK